MPSSAMFVTPPRSDMVPPTAASAYGTEMRTAVPETPNWPHAAPHR